MTLLIGAGAVSRLVVGRNLMRFFVLVSIWRQRFLMIDATFTSESILGLMQAQNSLMKEVPWRAWVCYESLFKNIHSVP